MPKSIILFSDGTGNSSAKLFKTNVWRMYEAVDLGPATEGKRDQISYYDDGVGTSSFKPLSVLGGAFGYGLKRNVLDIYRYACRNYAPGDDIYAFGFSRGAFTVRLVVALIASEGLVRSSSEAELDRKSNQAYRRFREDFLPRRLKLPTRLLRRARGAIGRMIDFKGRKAYNRDDNQPADIRFVGVWDTVSAYGGPITEITRAIDNWIYALSMPNYQLNERVACARHALAIDDERDAFHPLLWDEVYETQLIADGKVKEGRLEQVWFTGMHADVGGGYPDESLSYISLLWMMEEAEKAGLRTLTVIKDRIRALASSLGPIHDSRAGLAAYYRYQPRRIAAWLDPVDLRTLSLRDPAIVDSLGTSRGLLCSVKVHESVINRIATGTDRYAPITLPTTFRIVPPQVEGETAPQEDNQTPGKADAPARPKPMVSPEVRARLTDPEAAGARTAVTEPIWNYAWWRRLTYFATLTATLLLLGLPLFVARLPPALILDDGRTWIGGVIRLLTLILPSFAGKWMESYADNPFYFILLLIAVVVFFKRGTRLERTLRDRARAMWKDAVEGKPLPPPRSTLTQKFRNSYRYQRFIQFLKWFILPNGLVTPVMLALAIWLGIGMYAQMMLPILENGGLLCRPSPGAGNEIVTVRRDFHTWEVCSPSFGRVVKDERYVVTFDVVKPWSDGTIATNPEGLSAGDFPVGLGYFGMPFKRVINARYLLPIRAIRPARDENRWFERNVQIYPVPVGAVGDSVTMFRSEFTAERTGELFLFANDAMIPLTSGIWGRFDYRFFYEVSGSGPAEQRGNHGSACVTVGRAGAAERPGDLSLPTSVCGQAASRDAAQAAATKTLPQE